MKPLCKELYNNALDQLIELQMGNGEAVSLLRFIYEEGFAEACFIDAIEENLSIFLSKDDRDLQFLFISNEIRYYCNDWSINLIETDIVAEEGVLETSDLKHLMNWLLKGEYLNNTDIVSNKTYYTGKQYNV